MHKSTLLFYLCAFSVVGCPLQNPVPVEPDYPDASSMDETSSPCEKACKTFERLRCPEAQPTDSGLTCYRVCVKASALRKAPLACWANAPTVDALRACGGVRCVP